MDHYGGTLCNDLWARGKNTGPYFLPSRKKNTPYNETRN